MLDLQLNDVAESHTIYRMQTKRNFLVNIRAKGKQKTGTRKSKQQRNCVYICSNKSHALVSMCWHFFVSKTELPLNRSCRLLSQGRKCVCVRGRANDTETMNSFTVYFAYWVADNAMIYECISLMLSFEASSVVQLNIILDFIVIENLFELTCVCDNE